MSPKTFGSLFILLTVVLTGCSTTQQNAPQAKPETVLVTYRVKHGNEAELRQTVERAWTVYTSQHLVFAEPHVLLQDTEEGKPRFIEIFTWVDRSTPEHAPDAVMAVWKEEESLCEKRGGHYGIEPGEVQLLLPAKK
ncbi:MAG TPA: hypothetical protein VLT36_20455 [Candidatus Dormibacteraeota bacterium]|nr:hypothetical protein [Candidatus Dormibacteraeota bacterium]